MKKLNTLKSILRDILWSVKYFQYKVEFLSDNPNLKNLKENIIYVVGEISYLKWGYLLCPCGCKEAIMLSLNNKSFPSWTIEQDKIGRATIYPSIKRLEGCKSHFFIQNGKLIWSIRQI